MTDRSGIAERRPSPRRRRMRVFGIALSLGVHLVLLSIVVMAAGDPHGFLATTDEFEAITVDLTPPPKPPKPISAPKPDPTDASPAVTKATQTASPSPVPKSSPTSPSAPLTRPARPVPANVETVVAGVSPSPVFSLTDAELGGATDAGSGAGEGSGSGSGSGGSCDMVRRIQTALRANSEIRRVATSAHRALGSGRALLLWRGDWLQSPGQEGKGLAGVRQAIALEIAFAPVSCRAQSMRGWAVISLGDAPDSPRIVLGAAHWRWSDLSGGR